MKNCDSDPQPNKSSSKRQEKHPCNSPRCFCFGSTVVGQCKGNLPACTNKAKEISRSARSRVTIWPSGRTAQPATNKLLIRENTDKSVPRIDFSDLEIGSFRGVVFEKPSFLSFSVSSPQISRLADQRCPLRRDAWIQRD